MTAGQRCDEIMRLIDEVLGDQPCIQRSEGEMVRSPVGAASIPVP